MIFLDIDFTALVGSTEILSLVKTRTKSSRQGWFLASHQLEVEVSKCDTRYVSTFISFDEKRKISRSFYHHQTKRNVDAAGETLTLTILLSIAQFSFFVFRFNGDHDDDDDDDGDDDDNENILVMIFSLSIPGVRDKWWYNSLYWDMSLRFYNIRTSLEGLQQWISSLTFHIRHHTYQIVGVYRKPW